MEPLIVILGPTASGKSTLAVRIAKKVGGEVVSADSRQVYKGLDIGSGKITKREMKGVPHHLLNVASPNGVFSVARYQTLARKAIAGIRQRGRVPVVCGGTGLYIDAVTTETSLPRVPPDMKLRARLEKKTTDELFAMLRKLDPRRAADIDRHNPRRLIRALEIIMKSGRPVPMEVPRQARDKTLLGNVLKIGLRRSAEELKRRIRARLRKRLRGGMIAEVRRLHEKNGVSWRRLDDLGLEYRFVSRYLRTIEGNPSTIARDARAKARAEMIREIERASWQYARRQMTWWRKDAAIHWAENEREALALSARPLRRAF